MTKRKGEPKELILRALASIDKPWVQYHGLTDEEIASATKLDLKQVRKEVASLVRSDMVRDTYSKRAAKAGRHTTVWGIAPKVLPLILKGGTAI